MPKEVPGLLDAAYDFNTSGEIEEATLTFHFEDKYTKSDEFEPAIYYIDTQNQEMILLDEQIIDWDNHTVTAKTTHFSKYALLNKKEQEKAWKKDISSSIISKPNARIEVAFVIDESGSMAGNDPKKIRVDVAKKFIDTLRTGDKASIIGFSHYANTYQSMTDNLNKAKDSLQNISNDRGGTDLRVGLAEALKEFPEAGKDANAIESAMKIIVFLTDGQGTYEKSYEQTAIKRGVKIYTVGLGTSYDQGLLKSIANNTSGKFYHAGNANDLIEEFKKLTQDTIDIVSDKDYDGLSDYHEERIRLFNGVIIKLDKSNPDTDGDTLKDGQEIVQQTDKNGRVLFKLNSYPHKKDSDGDKINDNLDKRPLIPDLYKIDYLGSPKHLKSIDKRIDKIKKENEMNRGSVNEAVLSSIRLTELMNDYDLFLYKHNVDTTKNREDYWKDEWDKYWDSYCNAINKEAKKLKVVSERLHYFRNNLNRTPNNLIELNKNASKWVLLDVKSSVFHMYPTDFSGKGIYNLKFISIDGKYEGVYINSYGKENFNKNKGLACTEKTDPKNMGTYNYDGDYYDGPIKYISNGLRHYFLDVKPYEKYGNVSPSDLSSKEETSKNEEKFNNDVSAKEAREFFIKLWKGVTQ